MLWQNERPIWLRQIITTQSVSPIRWFRRHYPRKAKTFREFSVYVEKWRIDPQLIPWPAAQSFDVKGRPGFWILPNPRNVICPENENISPVRLNEVAAKLVDKDLIPSIHCAPGNNFTAVISPSGENVEIMTERLGRRINQKRLPLADQAR